MIKIKKTIYEDWEIEYIKSHYKYKTYKDITCFINSKNKIKKSEKQVRTKASRMGLKKINTNVNKDFFEDICNESNAYWLGFIYADGYININKTNRNYELGIQLSKKDLLHLQKFNDAINAQVDVKILTKKSGEINGVYLKERELCSIRIYSSKIVHDLESHNVKQNKTYLEEFPIINDKILFYHFVRGFLDGDGCIWYSKNRLSVKFTNANKNFLEYLSKIFLDDGFCSSLYTENKNKHNLYIRGDVLTFLNSVYKNASVYLERKYQLYINAVQSRNILNDEGAKSVKSAI